MIAGSSPARDTFFISHRPTYANSRTYLEVRLPVLSRIFNPNHWIPRTRLCLYPENQNDDFWRFPASEEIVMGPILPHVFRWWVIEARLNAIYTVWLLPYSLHRIVHTICWGIFGRFVHVWPATLDQPSPIRTKTSTSYSLLDYPRFIRRKFDYLCLDPLRFILYERPFVSIIRAEYSISWLRNMKKKSLSFILAVNLV